MEKVLCDWSNRSKVVFEVSCWKFITGQCSRSGRPAEVDNNQMETLIQINQYFTTARREPTYSKHPNQAWKNHLLSQYNLAQIEQLTPVLLVWAVKKSPFGSSPPLFTELLPKTTGSLREGSNLLPPATTPFPNPRLPSNQLPPAPLAWVARSDARQARCMLGPRGFVSFWALWSARLTGLRGLDWRTSEPRGPQLPGLACYRGRGQTVHPHLEVRAWVSPCHALRPHRCLRLPSELVTSGFRLRWCGGQSSVLGFVKHVIITRRLDRREFEWTPGDGDGQGGLPCCDSWGRKESDTTERLNWTQCLIGAQRLSLSEGSSRSSLVFLTGVCPRPHGSHDAGTWFCSSSQQHLSLQDSVPGPLLTDAGLLHRLLSYKGGFRWFLVLK